MNENIFGHLDTQSKDTINMMEAMLESKYKSENEKNYNENENNNKTA